jgi:hypothetical protein
MVGAWHQGQSGLGADGLQAIRLPFADPATARNSLHAPGRGATVAGTSATPEPSLRFEPGSAPP